MNIILVRKKSGTTANISLSRSFIFILSVFLLGMPFVSYQLGALSNKNTPALADINASDNIELIQNKLNNIVGSVYKQELIAQKAELNTLKQHNQENINALTNNLAKLQAHIFRLDSLGNRLTEVAKLDKKAFNFDYAPAMGGPADADEVYDNLKYSEFVKRMEQITEEISDKTQQLNILEKLLISESFKLSTTPSGKPVEKGWISSYFGMRKDPFSGKNKMHKGMDVAGKSGAAVIATADGVVIIAKKQPGYGKMLEIDHGYGISTRYGHNKTLNVKVGEVVKKGQLIASMGSSGRSTGPHVHYEVLRKGQPVNPQKYIITAKK